VNEGKYRVRLAQPPEITAARMMLPGVFKAGVPPMVFVATPESAPRILGVGAVVTAPWGEKLPGFRFAVKVAQPYRRRGVGRALVRAIADEARQHGARALRPWLTVGEDTPEAAMLRALGFHVLRRRFHFEADILSYLEHLRALRDRLRRKERIPPTVRVMPLREAAVYEVVALCRRHLGGDPTRIVRALSGRGPRACSAEHSVVLTVDGAVVGALLYGWDGEVARIDAQVLHPSVRRGWANVLLLTSAIERGAETGNRRIRFHCYDDVRDTLKLAQRCGAVSRGIEHFYALDLGDPALPRP
jgi:GNAT superfamily N-acetyltransferase